MTTVNEQQNLPGWPNVQRDFRVVFAESSFLHDITSIDMNVYIQEKDRLSVIYVKRRSLIKTIF